MSESTNEIKKKKTSQAFGFALSELTFILLPFVVMSIVFTYKHNFSNILEEPEWALASSVMFGQSIIKFIHVIGKLKKGSANIYNVGALISLIILLGLVPSLIVLSIIYTADIVPMWIAVMQIILFITAATLFWATNSLIATQEEEDEEDRKVGKS